MRFTLIDRIDAYEPGKFLRASKYLALGEEYLADHFPRFPVMPGVLMLQAVVEAASWLWRVSSGYAYPVIVLRETKNVKYGTFMQPGRRMNIAVDWYSSDGNTVTFRGKGSDDANQPTIAAKFTLTGYRLGDRNSSGSRVDAQLIEHWQQRWALLTRELTTEQL